MWPNIAAVVLVVLVVAGLVFAPGICTLVGGPEWLSDAALREAGFWTRTLAVVAFLYLTFYLCLYDWLLGDIRRSPRSATLIALVVFLVLVGVWLGVQMLFYYPVVPIGAEATLLALTHSAAVFVLWVLACVICWMLFRRAANI